MVRVMESGLRGEGYGVRVVRIGLWLCPAAIVGCSGKGKLCLCFYNL